MDLLARRLDAVEGAQARAAEVAPAPAVTLPEAVAVAPEPRPGTHPVVRIGIDHGGVTLDGAPVASDELDAALRRHAARPGVTGVILDAAPEVDHATVVALIDRIKDSGLGRVAIATRGRETDEQATAR